MKDSSLRVLPGKKAKFFRRIIEDQWGADFKPDFGFLMSNKNRLYAASKGVRMVDLARLKLSSIGLFFGDYKKEQLRLSVEGSQLVGPWAKKNVVEIPDVFVIPWLRGIDIAFKARGSGIVIVKNKSDFLGCGKVKDNQILNMVPVERRLMVEDLP